jgi:5-methylcytosine-specific restriction endonuclease McrA
MAATHRRAGRRYRKFRIAVLHRDGWRCTEPGCHARATELHHERALIDGGSELDPANARAVCHRCHVRLTGELRDRLGLPFRPGHRPAAVRHGDEANGKVWFGAISPSDLVER